MRYLSLAFALAACGGPARPAEEPAQDVSKCPQVGDHLVGLMKTGNAADAPMEVTDKVRNFLVERCTVDAWGMDAQQCFLGLAAIEDSDRCAGFLTVEQREAADRAIAEAFPQPAGEPEPVGAPPPAPEEEVEAAPEDKPKRQTRGAVPKEGQKTGDPCDGGE